MVNKKPRVRKFDNAVYIGRFQPVHKGHIETIKKALEIADNVIIVIGSAYRPRDPKNPWTILERMDMIQFVLERELKDDFHRIKITYCLDYMYNDNRWLEEVQLRVGAFIPDPEASIALIGVHKDATSFYLDMFPKWEYYEAEIVKILSATDVRIAYFEGRLEDIRDSIFNSTYSFLLGWVATKEFKGLKEEYDMLIEYEKSWKKAPYPPIFVTTDAIVIKDGYVLMVKRKAAPGKGTYALPGGFVNPDELLIDSMIRELKEETKIKVPIPVLKGSIVTKNVFDHPFRSLRGRTITHGYLIELTQKGALPKVTGADDAEKAIWIALADIEGMRNSIFEDHADIIENLASRI